jgi:two-component system OmpR family response regulator
MILTGNTEFSDQILGLELGADDFVAKSRPAREILARLRAMLRREAAPAPAEPAAERREGSGWWLDQMRRELVAPESRVVTLTSREFDLLACLARHNGAAVSRDELCNIVLGRAYSPLDRSVDNLVSRLRKKLARFPDGSKLLRSVRSQGYVLTGVGQGPERNAM